MSKRSSFQVTNIYDAERQIEEIRRLRDTLGAEWINIDVRTRTVTVEHDQTVTVAMIENALRNLRLNPSHRSTVDI